MKSHYFRGSDPTRKAVPHRNVTMPETVFRSNVIALAAVKEARKPHSFPMKGQRVREFAHNVLGWKAEQLQA